MSIPHNIKAAVERTMGQRAAFVESNPIVEMLRGKIVWEGIVSTFETQDGRKCYGWAIPGAEEPQYVTVIRKPPVHTPLEGVRAWIASQHKR